MNENRLEKKEVIFLKEVAKDVRKTMIENSKEGKVYHFGGSFSVTDILTYLYFYRLKNTDLNRSIREKVILSKGHACQSLYTILAKLGYLSGDELKTYKENKSILQGHPDMKRLKAIDYSSGSMGQGLSIGVGMAIGFKKLAHNSPINVILGDGEIQEGQIWEAAMSASKFQLDNLYAIIDYNKLQVDGLVSNVMPIEPISDKWRSFGWEVEEVDGHDFTSLHSAYTKFKRVTNKPKLIIAHTIKGKGIKSIEGNYKWHSNSLSCEKKQGFLAELRA